MVLKLCKLNLGRCLAAHEAPVVPLFSQKLLLETGSAMILSATETNSTTSS